MLTVQIAHNSLGVTCDVELQVLDNSLEAHVMRSDNSSLAKDCRKDIKAANTRLMKLGRKVNHCIHSNCASSVAVINPVG